MEAVSARGSRRAIARFTHVDTERRPLLFLIGGVLLIVLGAGLIAAHVTVFALDETLIEQSAVHYSSDLPHSLFHDLDARATNRLYSLVLSIAFRLFNGASAVRIDHVLSVVMFVSAAIPIYLIARVVLRSSWFAVAVALLSVAVPWLTLTSALYTENLSYPLFWWMLFATCYAVWRPSVLKDGLALLSIVLLVGTRVQFAAVFAGYVVALVAIGVWRADGSRGAPRRLASAAAAMLRRYPLTLVILVGGIAGFIYERTSSHWQFEVERLLGAYSNVVIRNGVPPNMIEGLLVELIALALGVGLLPAIVSLVWYAKRMSRPRSDKSWIFLSVAGIVIFFFLVLTVFSQGGYLGAVTEERYFFYVIPVFWLGTFAALQDRNVHAGELLGCTVGLAALYGAIPFLSPLSEETAFLAPVESTIPHVLTQRLNQFSITGLTVQDALVLLVLFAGALTAYIWSRRPGARLWWTVGAAAVVQLIITGYAFAVVDGKVQGIVGRTGGSVAALGWLDSNARSSSVTWLDNLSVAAPLISDASSTDDQQRATLFWNSRITSWAALPELGIPAVEFPLSALPGFSPLAVNPTSGLLTPQAVTAGMSEVVGATDSPFLQLAGTSLAQSPDGVLTLTKLSKPVRATWLATGLQPDGYIGAGAPVRLFAFAENSATPRARLITLTISPLPAPPPATSIRRTVTTIRFGSTTRRITLAEGSSVRRISLVACFPANRAVVAGAMSATRPASLAGSSISGVLDDATISSVEPQRAPRCGRR